MGSHGEGLHLQSCGLISHRKPLCAPSHGHDQAKLKPIAVKPRTLLTGPAGRPQPCPRLDPACEPPLCSQLSCSILWHLGVREPENQIVLASSSLEAWGPLSQLQLSPPDCTSPPPELCPVAQHLPQCLVTASGKWSQLPHPACSGSLPCGRADTGTSQSYNMGFINIVAKS